MGEDSSAMSLESRVVSGGEWTGEVNALAMLHALAPRSRTSGK